MQRSGLSRVIPVILIMIVIAAAVAGLISVGQSILGGDTQQPAEVNVGRQALTEVKNGSGIRMTVRGPIVANEEFHSYTITIRPNYRSITTYVGYNKKPLNHRELNNNKRAYEQFVYALSRLDFMNSMPLRGEVNDTRGICATGMLYEFEVLQNNKSVQKLWTTSCGGSRGSFNSNLTRTRELIQDQIPGIEKILGKVRLP